MGAKREQAEGAERSAAVNSGMRHVPCEIELDMAAGLRVAPKDADRGQGPHIADTRDLRKRAQAPPAGLGYRQEGIMAQVEAAPTAMLDPAHSHDGSLELAHSDVAHGAEPYLFRAACGQSGEKPRAEPIGRLIRFIGYAVENGVLDGDRALDTLVGRHMFQKQAYIAQELGMRIGYKFEFLKNGAYSPAMAVDVYKRGAAAAGGEAFVPDPMASRAFVRIVRKRDPEWLQVATFAVRDREVPGARDEFLNDRYGHLEYDRRLVMEVFAEVDARMEWLRGAAG